MASDKAKWLYSELTQRGYNVGKSAEEFDSLIRTREDSRKWAYNAARDEGLNVGKSILEFEMNVISEEEPQPVEPPMRTWDKAKQKAATQPRLTGTTFADAKVVTTGNGATSASKPKATSATVPTEAKTANASTVKSTDKAWQPTAQQRVDMTREIGGAVKFNEATQSIADNLNRKVESMTSVGRRKKASAQRYAHLAGLPTRVAGLVPDGVASDEVKGNAGKTNNDKLGETSLESPHVYGVAWENGEPKAQWMLDDGSLTTDRTKVEKAEYGARKARLQHQFLRRMSTTGLDPSKQEDINTQVAIDAIATGNVDKTKMSEVEAEMRESGLDPKDVRHLKWVLTGDERSIMDYRLKTAESRLKALKGERQRQQDAADSQRSWLEKLGHSVNAANNNMHGVHPSTSGAAQSQIDRDIEAATAEVVALSSAINKYKENKSAAQSGWFAKIYKGLWNGISDPNTWTMGVLDASVNHTLANADMSSAAGRSLVRSAGHASNLEAMAPDPGALYGGARFIGEMVADPVTYVSAGVGNVVGKGVTRAIGKNGVLNTIGRVTTGKAFGKGATHSMAKGVANRLGQNSLTARLIGASAGGGANFAVFEGLGNARDQIINGGYTDDDGVFHEGFSWTQVFKSGGRGLTLGTAMGAFGGGIGNVGNKLTKATSNAYGKVGVRTGQHLVSVVGEGTIFAMPEIIEFQTMEDDEFDRKYAEALGYAGERDPQKRAEARSAARNKMSLDVWTDSQAQILGMKISGKMAHGAKSPRKVVGTVASTLKELRGDGKRYGLSFRERLGRMMDKSPLDITMTAEEREELRRNGYGELADLFWKPKGKEKQQDTKKSVDDNIVIEVDADTVETHSEFDGYEAMERLMKDQNVSEAARAKAYYILTGRMLPMSTITGYKTVDNGDGYVYVNSVNSQGGVVTSRRFKKGQSGQVEAEQAKIKRQAEFNAVDVGEQFVNSVVDTEVSRAAIAEVVPDTVPERVMEMYLDIKTGVLEPTEGQKEVVRKIDEAIKSKKEVVGMERRPEAMRKRIKDETGIDVDAVLSKEPDRRSAKEQEVLQGYIDYLYEKAEKSDDGGYRRDSNDVTGRLPGFNRDQPGDGYESDDVDNTGVEYGEGISEEQRRAQALYDEVQERWAHLDDEDAAPWTEADAIKERMSEAYQLLEDAFGDEYERCMHELSQDPWRLLESEGLTDAQRDAVRDYISAKVAMEGLEDALNDSPGLKAKREARQNVLSRTHRDDGMLHLVEMKNGKRVYVISGKVVTNDDGSINVGASDKSIGIRDAETGEASIASPDMILRAEQERSSSDVINEEFARIDAEQEAMSAAEVEAEASEPTWTSMSPLSPGINEVCVLVDGEGNEYRGHINDITDDGIEVSTDRPMNGNVVQVLPKSEFDNMVVELGYEEGRPYWRRTDYDESLHRQQETAPSEVNHAAGNDEDGTPNGGVAVADDERNNGEVEQEPALSRIPKDKNGEPDFTAVDRETALDGLTELVGGNSENVAAIVSAQIEQASVDLNKLRKKPPTKKTIKLQGSAMAMAQAQRKADEAYAGEVEKYNADLNEAQQRLETWKAISDVITSREDEARRRVETSEQTADAIQRGAGSTTDIQEQSNDRVSKAYEGLNENEATMLLSQMEAYASEIPQIELNPTNWIEQFGENGMVSTPLGKVKMGENQIAKLFEKGRSEQFGMIKPTLEHPQIVVEVPSEAIDGNAERTSSLLFIKTFTGKNGKKVYYFKSVTIKKDGLEVSVSSHYDRAKRVKEVLKKGKLLYRFDGGAQTERHPADVSVTTSPNYTQGKDKLVGKHADNVSDASDVAQGLYSSQGNVSDLATEGTDASQTNMSNAEISEPTNGRTNVDSSNLNGKPNDIATRQSSDVSDSKGINNQSDLQEKSGKILDTEGGALSTKIETASADVNTNPTEAQKEAGNYKKGHVRVGGFDISIEQLQGSVRKGTDTDGRQWENKMHNAYGYIRGTEGVDGDHIDVFLSNDIDGWNGRKVYVVDQYNPDGSFDEHKVMLGFNDADEAMNDYLANYEKGWGEGRKIDVSAISLDDFEKWIDSSKRKTKPFAEYAGLKKETADVGSMGIGGSIGKQLYTITPATYTNKKGGVTDVSLLTFDKELTVEQERAVKEFAKEKISEGRFAKTRGWKDRESGGWMFRSEDDARKAAEMISNEEAVADNQPLTAAEMREAVTTPEGVASRIAHLEDIKNYPGADKKAVQAEIDRLRGENVGKKPKATKPAVNRVNIEDVFKSLHNKGEAKLSDHTVPVGTGSISKYKLVITDEMKKDEDVLRELLGIDDEIDGDIKFRDPDALSSQQRRWVYNAGVNYSLGYIDQGFVTFPEFAKAMVGRLGYKIKPWLKSFYEGAKRIPGYDQTMFTPTDEVDAFDVENFDKPQKDVLAQAVMVAAETKVRYVTDKANKELKEIRNEQRKAKDEQTAADTLVIAREAKTIADEAEALAETSEDRQVINNAVERIDESLDKISDQLALLGYYEAEYVEKDYNEAYGYMRNAEKKAVKDAANLATRLIDDLGLDKYEATHGAAGKNGKRRAKPLAVANIAPVGGDVTMYLPLVEGRELYVNIQLAPSAGKGSNHGGDNLEVIGIMCRVENPNAKGADRYGQNMWFAEDVTYDDLLTNVRRVAQDYLPKQEEKPAEQQNEDIFQKAERIANDAKAEREKKAAEEADIIATDLPEPAKKKAVKALHGSASMTDNMALSEARYRIAKKKASKEKVKPEQTVGDLFAGLFDEQKDNGLQRNDDAVRTEAVPTDNSGQQQGLRGGERAPRKATAQESGRSDGGRGRQSTGKDGAVSAGLYGLTQPKNIRNNHSERDADHAPTSVNGRIEANIKAIELAHKLLESGETATPEQMSVLRQFSGWGGLGTAFSDGGYDWKQRERNKKIRELLGEEAYEQAVMSANSAYYTPAYVVDTLWDIAKQLGFKGGNILEGSAGIGNILGQMPIAMSECSDIHAIEIDGTSGGILTLLYPDAKVDIQGFEQTRIPNGSVDLAITNVPFVTGLRVNDTTGDSDLSKKFHNIHDFCIAKNVRKLREGGLGIFISSNGTLDGSKALRDWVVCEGGSDFIGAFRMNNKTFGGTTVTSDIIVIRKRVNGQKSPQAIDVSTISGERTAEYQEPGSRRAKQISMDYNKYFMEHPDHMAGEMRFAFEEGDTFRPTSKGLYPVNGKVQSEMLADFVKSFTEETGGGVATTERTKPFFVNDASADGKRLGEMYLKDGNLVTAGLDGYYPLEVNDKKIKGHTKQECFNAYSAIKSALAGVMKYQTENESNAGLKPLIAKLNKAYDDFVNTYGHFNKNNQLAWLRNDVDYPNVFSLETYKEQGDGKGGVIKIYGKADVMKGRVVEKESEPHPENVKDGVVVSMFKNGRIDIPYIASQLGKSEEAVKREIIDSGLGFEDPTTRQVEVSYQYLSGNVREKLKQAEANNENGEYDKNIKALQDVVPMNIPAHLIDFTLGSSWLDSKLYDEYVKDRTGIDVHFTAAGGTWFMKAPTYGTNVEKNRAMGIVSEMLKKTIMGHELIAAAIQNKSVVVSRTEKHYDGTTETITDREATAACAAKIDEIRQDFKDWARQKMQSDADLSAHIEQEYNDRFNNYVPMNIPNDFVPEYFKGATHKFKMRPHQGKAIVRGTMQPLLLAHEVGTGKTFTLISTAMEMRRLGTARKPMIVVQNATVGQFAASAKELYPNAKILTLEDNDRNADGRKNFYAKIKYNDWDMIVVPQSTFEFIPDSDERQMQFVKDKIDEKKIVLEQMREAGSGGRDPITRRTEKELVDLQAEMATLSDGISKKRTANNEKKKAVAKQNAAVKAQEMLDRRTDDVENFDDMGIDALLIDEAHEYKHLGFATAMQRGVKGIDPSYSKKSQGVYLKTQAILEKNNGRNVIFATGTPISNTAAEIWTFMRYLMPKDTMKEYGIYYFDDFVRNFGNLQQMMEFKTNGKFQEVNRFAGYVNLPELVRIWSGVADTVLTKDQKDLVKRIPDIEGGKARDIYLPQTRALRSVMKYVRAELDRFDKMDGREKKVNSSIPLTMYSIAQGAAVDARLVEMNAEDDPKSKTNEAVRQTLRSLKETDDYKGTVAIFADHYRNKRSGFNLYDDIKKKLIQQGVPANEVVVMTPGMKIKKKLDIFDKVNRGEVRVVLGSTATLGTGVNIQERLHTLIHLDAPNRPMDYTQRNGRILRQGNLHKQWGKPVRVLHFGVEDSLDVTAYQRLKTKGAIADSVMEGDRLMHDSMNNRVLEEEEDVFGDTVAQLSGSEYALLKNNAEKNVRKYESRKKQWEADQTYIHNTKPKLEGQIKAAEKRAEEANAHMLAVQKAFPDGKFTDITIGKQKFGTVDDMADFIKEHNKKILDVVKAMKENPGSSAQTNTLTLSLGGYDFVVKTELTRETVNNGGMLFADVHRKMTYSCPELELTDVPVRQSLLRNAVEDITENVITGKDFAERFDNATRAVAHGKSELEQLKQREGKPFEFGKELEEAKSQLEEYSEAMKAEMEEKEKKYAEMDASVEAATDVVADDEDETPEDKSMLRDGAERAEELDFVNEMFNERLGTLTDTNADKVVFSLGRPSAILRSAGVEDRPMKLYGNKVMKKMRKHGFALEELRDLPRAVADPIAVFDNYGKDGNRSVLTELKTQQGNFLVAIDLGKGVEDIDFNIISSVFGKGGDKIVDWLNKGYATYINKKKTLDYLHFSGSSIPEASNNREEEKAMNYLHHSAPIAEALSSSRLSTATKVVENFVNPKIYDEIEFDPTNRYGLIEEDETSRDMDAMTARVNELAERLHTSVRIVCTDEEVAALPSVRQRRMKGSFNPLTGEIIIVVPNNANVADIENTFIHEVVGHNGLRVLFPDKQKLNNALDELYRVSEDRIKANIDSRAQRMYDAEVDRLREKKRKEHEARGENVTANYYSDMAEAHAEASEKRDQFRRDATEEYGADLAGRIGESGFEKMSAEERTFWGRLRAMLQKALQKLLEGLKIPGKKKWSDKEWAFVEHEGYKRKKNGGNPTVFDAADTEVMRRKTGFGEMKFSDGKRERQTANERFNSELTRYQNGEMDKNEMLHLGRPQGVMRAFLPNLPIIMRQRVIKKGSEKKHKVDVSAIMNMPQHLSSPIFVFQRSEDTIGVLTDMRDRNGKNVCVAIELKRQIRQGAEYLEVNDVRSFHGREFKNIVEPIANNKTLKWVDKGKGLAYLSSASQPVQQEIDKQILDTATKVVKDFVNPKTSDENVADDGIGGSDDVDLMFRDGDSEEYNKAMARDIYEQRVSRGMYQSKEALQDSMLGLKEAMLAILKAEGKKMYIEDVAGYENAYLGENRLSSVNQAECSAFANLLFKPMLKEVANLAKTAKGRGKLIDYMMAKHGLERNEVMARRDAEKRAKEEFKDELRKAEQSGSKSMLDKVEKDVYDREEELYLKNRNRDYAGLTALTGLGNVAEAELEAVRMVNDYENTHKTDDLWKDVNAVTGATLSKMHECGLIDKTTYDNIKGMYEHYIPLRGFAEKTSSEAYAYLSDRHSAFNSPIKTAKGRKSKADDPFANMEAMAESAIMQGNRNKLVKQKFFNFVLNHPSDLVSVSDLWLRYDDAAGEWRPINTGDLRGTEAIEDDDSPAEVKRKMRDFEEAMEQAAQADPDHYKRQKDNPAIPYKVIESRDLRQHQVLVKRNGKDYILTINGNPRAAQALNGQTNPDNDFSGTIGKLLVNSVGRLNRFMAENYTTRNPDFIASNFMRDMLYSNTMVWVKESPKYALRFNRNFAKVSPVTMKMLIAKFRKGTLDMDNETEKMFYQFMMNGGETGYVSIRDMEKRKNDIKRELQKYNEQIPVKRAWKFFWEWFDEFNRAAENSARFAAFMTSRQMGRSIDRSIYDAKEISVNFNKKGSGAKFMGETGQTALGNVAAFTSGYGRQFIVFWNAAIQGTVNYGRQYKRHPVKATARTAIMFMLGSLAAYCGAFMFGGDDDDENAYYNRPENERRSNIIFRVPGMDNSWISIPLPVEDRVAYGMGELIMSVMSGKEHYTNGELAHQIACQVSQVLPVDFMEGNGGLKAFVPSSIKPVADVLSNESWTGQPIYKDTDYNKDKPEWTKAYKSTNKYLVGLSRALNEVTGGDDYTSGMIDINPAQVEYLLNGFFGGRFATADKAAKMGETAFGDREYNPRNFLLLNRFVKQDDERTKYRKANSEYYKIKDESEALRGRLNHYRHDTENGITDYSEKISGIENSPEYRIMEVYEAYSGVIDDINKDLSNAKSDEETKALELELNQTKKAFVDDVNEIREGKTWAVSEVQSKDVKQLLADYDEYNKEERELKALKDTDNAAYWQRKRELLNKYDKREHLRVRQYKHDIKDLTDEYLRTKDESERDSIVRLMFNTRDKMLEDVGRIRRNR